MAIRRSPTISELADSPSDSTRHDTAISVLVSNSDSDDSWLKKEQPKKGKKKDSLRRCKSFPFSGERKYSQETQPGEWKSAWDKERGYVTDLIAENQPVKNQPQLSYFAYLGARSPHFVRYQAVSSDADVIINLGTDIISQNRATDRTNSPERKEFQGESVYASEPLKPDRTQLIECCTCMCCVKAVFYHCTKDDEDSGRNWADEPCSCEEPGIDCAAGWCIMGIFSLFIPCLVCYPVMKICSNISFKSLSKQESKGRKGCRPFLSVVN